MVNRADSRRRTDDRALAGIAAARLPRADVYLTDGVFLFRVIDQFATGAAEMVELEDCYRLDSVRVPVGKLRARRLRVVAPAPSVAKPNLRFPG